MAKDDKDQVAPAGEPETSPETGTEMDDEALESVSGGCWAGPIPGPVVRLPMPTGPYIPTHPIEVTQLD